MFPGISHAMNDPATHAEFVYAHTNGLFAGIWGSNVDSGDDGLFGDNKADARDFFNITAEFDQ